MTDNTANRIIAQLKQSQPDVDVVTITQELPADVFVQQKEKHLSHGGLGGVIGIILTPEDKVVLALRSKLNAGWSLPGGSVEEGESFEETFKREILEEVGVHVSSSRLVMIEMKRFLSPSEEELYFVLATYLAAISETSLPAPTADAKREGLLVDLFDLEQLPNGMIFDDQRKIETYARTANRQRPSRTTMSLG